MYIKLHRKYIDWFTVDVLLLFGSDINFSDCSKPGLMWSLWNTTHYNLKYNALRKLLKRGADPNIKDKRGRNVMTCVVDMVHNSNWEVSKTQKATQVSGLYETFSYLVDAGFEVHQIKKDDFEWLKPIV